MYCKLESLPPSTTVFYNMNECCKIPLTLFLPKSMHIQFKITLLHTTVPTPNVSVTALNTQTVGQSLTLECSVTTVRGITSRVDIIWSRNDEEFNRTNNISSTMIDTSLIYTDTYTIQLLNTDDEDAVFGCEAVINTSPPVMATGSVTLDVMGE